MGFENFNFVWNYQNVGDLQTTHKEKVKILKDLNLQIRKIEILGGPYNYLKGFKFYDQNEKCVLDITVQKGLYT